MAAILKCLNSCRPLNKLHRDFTPKNLAKCAEHLFVFVNPKYCKRIYIARCACSYSLSGYVLKTGNFKGVMHKHILRSNIRDRRCDKTGDRASSLTLLLPPLDERVINK